MFIDKDDNINPNKIISLVPSLTELLFDLGLENKIKGITQFCISPAEKVKTVEKIGGTKNINLTKIEQIKPDLIIASKEENVKEQIEKLSKKYNIYLTDINTFDNALSEIKNIGKITKTEKKAKEITNKIIDNFTKISSSLNNKTFAFFIWNKPLMVVGQNTFINDIMAKIGGKNIYNFKPDRYPETTITEIENLKPDIIFLSTEPYKFTEKHKKLFVNLNRTKIFIVECEYFAWYGSRLIKTPEYINKLLKKL